MRNGTEVNTEGSESTVRGGSLDNMPISVAGHLGTEDHRVTTGLHSVQPLWDTCSDCASNSGVCT